MHTARRRRRTASSSGQQHPTSRTYPVRGRGWSNSNSSRPRRCQGLGGDEPGRACRPPPAHSPPVPERGPARGGTLADKVAAVHGERHPELSTMRSFFGELRADLEPHLLTEECILVPMIRELAAATAPKFHCGTLAVVLRCRSPWCSEACERRRSAVSTQAGTASCSWQSTRRSRSASAQARSRQRALDRGPGGW